MELQEALKKGTIIDVRSYHEFNAGSVVDAKNFPLNELSEHIEELKSFAEPLVLCCASGNKSGMATNLLINEGMNCINGGSWLTVNYQMSKLLDVKE